MTIITTEKKLLANAVLKTKETINPKIFDIINSNLSLILSDEDSSAEYDENTKITYLDFNVIDKYIIIMKYSISEGHKTPVNYCKIMLSEFETVDA